MMTRHPLADWLDAGDAKPLEGPPDDEAEVETRPRGRLRWLLAAAAAPWVALAVGMALPDRGAERGAEVAADAPTDPLAPTEAPAEPPVQDASIPDQPVPEEAMSSALGEQLPHGVEAAALVALRMGVSEVSGDRSRHVDAAAVESVTRHDGVWIVRLVAVVLEGDLEAWRETVVERFAVAVTARPDGTASAAGDPWSLPDPGREDRDDAVVAWQRGEPVEGIETALGDAGFRDVTDLAVFESVDLPATLRATFTTRDGPREAWVGLEPGPRVLGLPPGADRTQERPHE